MTTDMATHSTVLDGEVDLADVLHDLGQPLAAIRALAAVPPPRVGEPGQPDELCDRLRRIGELGDWMNELLSAGRLVPADPPRTADLVRVVENVVLTAAASFEGVLRWTPAGSAPVAAPPTELRRAVGNLVDNAVRAAGPGGSVRVRVRRVPGRATVEVEDDGPGLGRVPARSGRGLAVTRAVVDRCGGVLQIGNGRSGGVRVRMTLPSAGPESSG